MFIWYLILEGSVASVESGSPAERHLLHPAGSLTAGQEHLHGISSCRRPKYTSESNPSSLGSDSPCSSGQLTPTPPQRGPFSLSLRDDDDFEGLNRSFGQSTNGQLLICQCPPDAELPGFDRRDFSWVLCLVMRCHWKDNRVLVVMKRSLKSVFFLIEWCNIARRSNKGPCCFREKLAAEKGRKCTDTNRRA